MKRFLLTIIFCTDLSFNIFGNRISSVKPKISTSAFGPTIDRKHWIIGCVTSKFNLSQMLEFNVIKFCLNKFDFMFASIFDSTLVLILVEVNLMGAKWLLNQTLCLSRPLFERINF
jgi:hypothetical protein